MLTDARCCLTSPPAPSSAHATQSTRPVPVTADRCFFPPFFFFLRHSNFTVTVTVDSFLPVYFASVIAGWVSGPQNWTQHHQVHAGSGFHFPKLASWTQPVPGALRTVWGLVHSPGARARLATASPHGTCSYSLSRDAPWRPGVSLQDSEGTAATPWEPTCRAHVGVPWGPSGTSFLSPLSSR